MAFLQKFANLSGYSPKLNILVTNIIPEEIGLDLAIPEIAKNQKAFVFPISASFLIDNDTKSYLKRLSRYFLGFRSWKNSPSPKNRSQP